MIGLVSVLCCSSESEPLSTPNSPRTSIFDGEGVYFRDSNRIVEFQRMGSNLRELIAENQLLVSFREGASDSDTSRIHEWLLSNGAKKIGQIPQIQSVQYELNPQSNMNDIIDTLEKENSVLSVTPNFSIQPALDPNPYPGSDLSKGYWWIDEIRAREAWDITIGSEKIPVAVVDSGIYTNSGHFDAKDITYVAKCSTPDGKVKFVQQNHSSPECADTGSYVQGAHGTEVASVLAARGDDGKGGVGVAWKNPIISVDVYGTTGPSKYGLINLISPLGQGLR